ncbi:auxin-responsive protein IAA4-like isoform X1 [Hibiscus syriacus]|uniref:auxin-responsive protein IAA4-like isoform X1 n=1 Tax=Hibiscus syriacus TaxID=106335 RepID=UPI0019215F38|nr:auxin-responsive protein IAA4-like isoform X1 [Hibiscus syriacus]
MKSLVLKLLERVIKKQLHPTTKQMEKAQVVGWPPILSYRKNSLQTKKTQAETCGMYVKVSMDGAPYLRKIDLKMYKGYPELLKAMEGMFKFKVGKYSEREGYNGSEFMPTYEDKDGDWMLVGDYHGSKSLNLRTYVHTYVCMYICMYVCIFICTYVYMYIRKYVGIENFKEKKPFFRV